MHVIHVSETTDGGLGTYLDAMIRHQLALGYSVTLASPASGARPEALRNAGARYERWDATPRPEPGVARELAVLRRILRDGRPDMIHLHNAKAGLCGRLILRTRLPTIFQPHGLAWLAKEGLMRRATLRWERFAARWAHVFVCVSDGERQTAERAGVAANFHVIPNGIDTNLWPAPGPHERADARRRLGLGDGPVVVCSGRLHRSKNQLMLVDAWREVRRRVPDARLVLVGEGPDRATIESRATAGVQLVGDRDDVRDWLVAATLVAQPSKWEGLSLSVLEALATARSVVATDVPGMRDVIADDAGAVVGQGDEEAVTDAIAERLRDPESADREGARGRARIEARHSLRGQLDRLADLYGSLMEARARG